MAHLGRHSVIYRKTSGCSEKKSLWRRWIQKSVVYLYEKLFLKLSFPPRGYVIQYFEVLYNCNHLKCNKMQQNNLIFLHLGFQYFQEYTHTYIPSFPLLRAMCSESMLIFKFSLNLPNCSACQEIWNGTASYFRENMGEKRHRYSSKIQKCQQIQMLPLM